MAELRPDNPYIVERFADPENKVEFPPEAKKKFEWILSRYPTKMAALLPTLHLAQEVWGWISPEAMVYIGDLLDLSPATVYGVVTFYHMYNLKPVGKYHVQVCTNLSCMIRGAYDLYEQCHEKHGMPMGGVSQDGRFTLMEVECLGSCGTAPVVQINNDYHEDMDPQKLDRLIEKLK